MNAQIAANALPLIESAFAFLVRDLGFALVQSTDFPSQAWFSAGERSVVVRYDFTRDAAVDVELVDGATEETYRLHEVLVFEPTARAARREGVRDPDLLTTEMRFRAALLAHFCREFLAGDATAFRRRFREALLVQTTRAAAMHEFYRGDPERARRLYGGLRAYWDDRDREHVAQLEAETPLVMLRAKTAR